ncbi:hypothetical protein CVT26_012823 [Gymnopilus dilepis]|uniref:Uncharacterized protein n=1 Tax=Gymnopilus dilepis TaxID=231916 RepID=A0A409X449_9AGAR|nr:hypothetical protein CVT26_012823 [Gymnopilus dilepis]
MATQAAETAEQQHNNLWNTPRTPKAGQRRRRNEGSAGHSPIIDRKRRKRTYVTVRGPVPWPEVISPLDDQNDDATTSVVPHFEAALRLSNDISGEGTSTSSRPQGSRSAVQVTSTSSRPQPSRTTAKATSTNSRPEGSRTAADATSTRSRPQGSSAAVEVASPSSRPQLPEPSRAAIGANSTNSRHEGYRTAVEATSTSSRPQGSRPAVESATTGSRPQGSRSQGPPPINFGTKPVREKMPSVRLSFASAPAVAVPPAEHSTALQPAFEHQPIPSTLHPVPPAAEKRRQTAAGQETRLEPAFGLQSEVQSQDKRGSHSRYRPAGKYMNYVKSPRSPSPIPSPPRELPIATPSPEPPSLTKPPDAIDVISNVDPGVECTVPDAPANIETPNRPQQVFRTYLDRPKPAQATSEHGLDNSGLFTDPESEGDDSCFLDNRQTAATEHLSAGPSAMVKHLVARPLPAHEQPASPVYQSPRTSELRASRPRLSRVPQDGYESADMSPPREKTTSENPYKATAKKKKPNQQ